MSVQDDVREQELCRLFNLAWDPVHQRSGFDALMRVEVEGVEYQLEVEVKSSTTGSVSTARDVSMEHIRKWRQKLFVIGFYAKGKSQKLEVQRALCLTPNDMEPWISAVESYISIDYRLASLASRRLELEDLYIVCGQQDHYSIDDAKRLHKQQWSAAEYADSSDLEVDGQRMLSPGAMLKVLRLRAKYIAERGATLNNPHITKTHLKQFFGTDREAPNSRGKWADVVEKVAADFVRANPGHQAVRAV